MQNSFICGSGSEQTTVPFKNVIKIEKDGNQYYVYYGRQNHDCEILPSKNAKEQLTQYENWLAQ